ncbi:pyruvate formate lyase-activating protein [Vibrio sp. 10N.286.49.C2]|uniref:glycyl-radical enzyme activating protein n=1 Tax=unclassified Vibrio TaxID=2614977 RepID=UPI000C860BDD|nr:MULTISPECIES: glycyl-radical enzyme activating protein [unclassified Vibrio]PMH26441.1 pyruvate formate lyase-activating protein [Vibrio sp. 10N.286.49.C2]PMH54835.1 pyruvate formate lyase-activating protein [Vibrio sp. 10N.286.49.B1]PMH82091.1 pyruvate formate lyase-activating protein [Vibrio sp. 10N.286.48.B7]
MQNVGQAVNHDSVTGIVFDIQKFSVNDGPGVRTAVFMKGCQMKCVWCHNPESLSSKRQLAFSETKCVGCRDCASVCPNDVHQFDDNGHHSVNFELCNMCGLCVDACMQDALKIYGKSLSVDAVFQEVIKDKVYFDKSGGGITLSGGEALKQFEFCLALAKKCKENGVHVCVETNGASKASHYEAIAPYVDLFLFDYKATGHKLHKELTGMTRTLVDENLHNLNKLGAPVILRCPIIPGYNLSDEHLKAISLLSESMSNIVKTELLPYHNFGKGKAAEIGRQYHVDAALPEDEEIAQWLEKVKSYGEVDVTLS